MFPPFPLDTLSRSAHNSRPAQTLSLQRTFCTSRVQNCDIQYYFLKLVSMDPPSRQDRSSCFFFFFKLGRDTDNQPNRQRYPNQQVKKVGNKEEKRLKTHQKHYDKNQKSPRQRRCGTGRNDRTKDTAWINQLREDNETQVQHIRAEQVIINLTGSGNETRQEESDQNYNRERAGNVENNSSCDNWIHTKWSHPLLVFN